MKKNVSLLILCLLILPCLFALPGGGAGAEAEVQACSMTGYITSSGVNIRSGPGTEYASYGSAGAGEVLRIVSLASLSDGTVWYYGEVGGISGWVHGAYVSLSPVSAPTAAPAAPVLPSAHSSLSFTAVVSVSEANVRYDAGTDAAIAARLEQGTLVSVLSGAMDGEGVLWYYCEYAEGLYGYIRADLVSAGTAVPTSAPASLTVIPVSFTGYTNTSAVNVRDWPGGEKTGQLRRGSRVSVTGEVYLSSEKWYRVTWSGGEGFIRADLISRTAPAAATAAPTAWAFTETSVSFIGTVCRDNCNVRLQPSLSAGVLFRASLGDALQVRALCVGADGALWYRAAAADGREGYILAELVSSAQGQAGTVPLPASGASGTVLLPEAVSSPVPDVSLPGDVPPAVPDASPQGFVITPRPAPTDPPIAAQRSPSPVPDIAGGTYAPVPALPADPEVTLPPEGTFPTVRATAEASPEPLTTPRFITSGPTVQPTAEAFSDAVLTFEACPCTPGQTLSVYSAPRVIAWRTDGGSASLVTTDNLWCAGYDGEWLLVLYNTPEGDTRVGYISALSLQGALPQLPSLGFAPEEAVLTSSVCLNGDPIGESDEITVLEAGQKVTRLCNCYLGSTWAYVETLFGGMPVRGFVPQSALAR